MIFSKSLSLEEFAISDGRTWPIPDQSLIKCFTLTRICNLRPVFGQLMHKLLKIEAKTLSLRPALSIKVRSWSIDGEHCTRVWEFEPKHQSLSSGGKPGNGFCPVLLSSQSQFDFSLVILALFYIDRLFSNYCSSRVDKPALLII